MEALLDLISQIDRIKQAVCLARHPLNLELPLPYGEQYVAHLAEAVSALAVELARLIRERRCDYYRARRQHGDESDMARSLHFEYGFARQTMRDLEHFEELAVARVAAG